MDTTAIAGILQGIPGAVDVLDAGAAEARNFWALDRLGNLFNGLEITIGSDRETRFDDIDVELLKLAGNAQLFFDVHTCAR